MLRSLKETWSLLSAPSKLRLDTLSPDGTKRQMPLGMTVAVWLRGLTLLGVALIFVAMVIIAAAATHGRLPTFVALLIDKQTANGTVDSVQRSQVTKGKGLKVTRWTVAYHFTLPNGQPVQGKSYASSTSLKQGAAVPIEYCSSRPKANRIRGMTASSDSNNITVLAFVALAVGLFMAANALRAAYTTTRFLKTGLLTQAVITQCSQPRSRSTLEMNGLRFHDTVKGARIPLAEYQRQVLEQHRVQFDGTGKYIGTRAARSLHVALAAFYGVLICAFIAFAVTLVFFGRPHGWVILGSAIVGASAMSTIEVRSRYLLNHNTTIKSDDVPAGFKKVTCTFEAHGLDTLGLICLDKELDLRGDASDASPQPILYLPHSSNKAKLVSDLGLTPVVGAGGEYSVESDAATPLLIALAAILIVGVLGLLLACLI